MIMIFIMDKNMRRRRWGWILVVIILLVILLGRGVQILFWGSTRNNNVEIRTHFSSLVLSEESSSPSSRFHHLLGHDPQYYHHFEEPPNTKTPRYLHLSFADAKSSSTSAAASVRIHFSTLEDTEGTPVVTYGLAGTTTAVATANKNSSSHSHHRRRENDEKQEGISTHISLVCGAPANQTLLDPSWQIHTVTLDHLQPNALYHYQVGMAQGQGIVWNDNIYSFLSSSSSPSISSEHDDEDDPTPPPPPPYRYLVMANQGVPSLGMLGSLWTSLAIAKEIQRGKRSILQGNNNTKKSNVTVTTPSTTKTITAIPIRSVHHIGGLSHAQGEASIWKEWFQMIQIYASHVPLLVGMGPSEYSYYDQVPSIHDVNSSTLPPPLPPPTWSHYQRGSSGGECGQPIQGHFFFGKTATTSTSPSSSQVPFWYSQDEGLWLHTIVLSSEHDLRMGSEQYQWLVNDLQEQQEEEEPPTTTDPKQPRHRRRWIVVEIHRPLYHNQAKWHDEAMGVGLRRILEPLLRRYHVDLVVSGRYASYFRSCPGLWQSTCHDSDGSTHVTIGTAGVPLDTTVGTFPTHWAASFRADAYGYGRITIYNASTLHWEFVQVQIPNDDVTSATTDTATAMMITAAQERRRMLELLEGIDVDDDDEPKVLDEVWLQK